jgi:hypothetical protein
MISKYGMSREAMHYGDIVESSLPLITDAEVYQPLEADLERVQTMFRDRMGRFMQKRSRNKLHYKIGKEKKFYINELVMYKVYKPESMLHPTYTGPARIIDLGVKGATLRDPKTGATFSVSFENLRKINFEELLTLLPQNFDAEIADTLGTYRYRRALADPEQAPETVQIGSDPEPESEPEPDLIPVPEPVPDPTETTAGPRLVVNPDHPDDPLIRKTRSGKVYAIKPASIPAAIRDTVWCATLRMMAIPKVAPGKGALPSGPCLKRRYENKQFSNPETHRIWDPGSQHISEKSLEKIVLFKEHAGPSIFKSREPATQKFILKSGATAKRVKFGVMTVFFV